MSNRQTVWVDVERCTGCGACIDACPVEALALVNGKASVDEEMCTRCQACVDACPEGAIQPVVRGEIVTVRPREVPAVRPAGPLAETAGVAVAVASVSVLAQVAGRLARAVGRWLAQGLTGGEQAGLTTSSPQQGKPLRFSSRVEGDGSASQLASRRGGRERAGRGRQARRRHRGA